MNLFSRVASAALSMMVAWGLAILAPQPALSDSSSVSMFRYDPAHGGAVGGPAPAQLGLDWYFDTGGKIRATPTVSQGVVVVGSEDGGLYALGAENGELRWGVELGAPITATAAIVGERVLAVGGDGRLHALRLDSGSPVWEFRPEKALLYESYEDDPRSWDFYDSSPVVHDGRVYFGSGDGNVYALRLEDGQEIWRFSTGAVVRATPAVAEGIVYAGGMDGLLHALDADTGEEIWSFDTPGSEYFPVGEVQGSPAVADGRVVFGARDGRLYALDAASGEQKWAFDHEGSWVITSPAIAEGTVFAGSSDGEFFQAVSLESGEELWLHDTKSRVFSSPTVAGGLVVFGTWDGILYGLDVRDGTVQGGTAAECAILSSPVVAGGRLYVGSDESRLYCFSGPAFDPDVIPERRRGEGDD